MTQTLLGRQLGPYRVDALIGVGGMAEVYKAYQPSTERYVAIKALPHHLGSQSLFLERFRREARLIANLRHTHILPVFDFGESEGYAYLVMPLMENGTIATRVRGKRVALDEVIRVGIQIGDALGYAHQQHMVHRDVKPGNILLDTHGNCLLSDFGIARLTASTSALTPEKGFAGTPAYMAPEQAGGTTIDGRADLYALGVVMFELATGKRPFEGDDPYALVYKHLNSPPAKPREINPDLPEAFESIILRLLAKSPPDRPATAADLVRALRAVPLPAKSTRPSAPRAAAPAAIAPDAPTQRRADAARDSHPKTPAKAQAAKPEPAKAPMSAAQRPGSKATAAQTSSAGIKKTRRALDIPRTPRAILLASVLASAGLLAIALLSARLLAPVLRPPAAPDFAPVSAAPTAAAAPTASATAPATLPATQTPGAIGISAPTETPLGPTVLIAGPSTACTIAQDAALPMDAALATQLGCPEQAVITARPASVQIFEGGVMILFARGNGAFGAGAVLYALSRDQRAWRTATRWVQRDTAPDSWYSCDVPAGQTPTQSGIPWREFGAFWCADPEVRRVFGRAIGEPVNGVSARFQSFDRGRVFRLTNWPGSTGLPADKVFTVSVEGAGSWR